MNTHTLMVFAQMTYNYSLVKSEEHRTQKGQSLTGAWPVGALVCTTFATIIYLVVWGGEDFLALGGPVGFTGHTRPCV